MAGRNGHQDGSEASPSTSAASSSLATAVSIAYWMSDIYAGDIHWHGLGMVCSDRAVWDGNCGK